ncbi:hypothetical protein FB451DRAFT_1242320 [Mycena latifolia]|nr:hypothetical protein FB451DRAFT_1242320 [Mycena latifolia]
MSLPHHISSATLTEPQRLASTSSVPDPLHPHLPHLLPTAPPAAPPAPPSTPLGKAPASHRHVDMLAQVVLMCQCISGLCWRSCSRCGEHTDHLCHEAPAVAQLRTLPQLPTHLVVSRLAVPCVLRPCPHNIFIINCIFCSLLFYYTYSSAS